jgi:anaerobic magnesium-protoporphyrin IX monomethyl ester cyclase
MTKESDPAVAIIIPPSPFLADERVFPFLGPLRVAAQLQKNGNHVEVVDLSGFKNYEDIISDYVQGTSIRRFGITATTPQLPSAINIRNKIHESIDNPQIILGGPHTTLTHAAYTRNLNSQQAGRGTQAFEQLTENFDQLVVGDGELAIFEALAKPDQKIIDAGNLRSSLFLKRGSIDNFLFPARELIDLDSYHYQIDGKRAFSVIGQLGCPFECGFCGGRDAQSFRMTRVRSVGNVIEEIEGVVTKSTENGNPYA